MVDDSSSESGGEYPLTQRSVVKAEIIEETDFGEIECTDKNEINLQPVLKSNRMVRPH